jgi:pSer/pThr/pTyr-binding forkhead associated (FHA) protein
MNHSDLGIGFGGGDAGEAKDPASAPSHQPLQMGSSALEVTTGRTPGVRFLIDRVSMLIGRHDPPDIEVDIDLTPQEMADTPVVSRRHAEVSWVDGRLTLRDLGSSNGTYVNDTRLSSPGLGQPSDAHDLHAGDVVRLANIVMRMVSE